MTTVPHPSSLSSLMTHGNERLHANLIDQVSGHRIPAKGKAPSYFFLVHDHYASHPPSLHMASKLIF